MASLLLQRQPVRSCWDAGLFAAMRRLLSRSPKQRSLRGYFSAAHSVQFSRSCWAGAARCWSIPAGILLGGSLGPVLAQLLGWRGTMLVSAGMCWVFALVLQPLHGRL